MSRPCAVRDPVAGRDFYQRHFGLRPAFDAHGGYLSPLDDERPAEDDVSFRCWDPDGTEIEVFWET